MEGDGDNHEFNEEEDFDHENDEYRDHEEEEEYDDGEMEGEEDGHHADVFHSSIDDHQESPGQGDDSDHHEHHEHQRQGDASDDLNASFEKDTTALTKIKATIMYNINSERERRGLPFMFEDITLTSVAMQFSASLKNNEYDQKYLDRLLESHRNDHCRFDVSYIKSQYEDDAQITKQLTMNYFIEVGYLFFERDEDSQILLRPTNNHVGIGLAGNQTNIVIVLISTQHDLSITEIVDKGDMIEVKGKMLQPSVGIFGVKIYNNESFDKIKKEKEKQEPEHIFSALYDKIDFNKTTKEFCVYLQMTPNWKERRWIELLTRENPEGIAYRKPRKDKQKDKNYYKHLKPKLRAMFIEYPDKQYIEEYKELTDLHIKKNMDLITDLMKKEQQERMREEERIRQEQIQEQEAGEESDKFASEDSDQEVAKGEQNKDGAVSNKQIREELQLAITEARNTFQGLMLTNKQLQEKIKELKSKTDSYIDKTGETMNEHKYLNTLTQVHQTRVDLQTTQDRYNRMSLQLQNKLNEKQARCNQIRVAFLELKRQVAKKAAYSRSDLPIKQNRIDDWELREKQLADELQTLRLQILRARNTLSKNQKILKKKEELAEGLHLIDFEQLKIQNQTLNQKIEERNEDLHKLKKKTTTIVQILTHTRQKLGFVRTLETQLKVKLDKLDEQIQKLREALTKTKKECENLKLDIQDAKQQTEIVNSRQLVIDYKKITLNTKQLEREIKQLQEREKQMKTVIENYQRKMKKEVIKR